MKYFILIIFSILIQSCIIPVNNNIPPNKKNDIGNYALKEDFIENEIGWIEEKNEYHELEIKNGYYFIHSIDTSFSYTSTSPLDKSFLYGLKNFELETTFQLVKESPKTSQFGVFFISGTIEYNFILDFNGKCFVTEYNHRQEIDRTVIEREIKNFDNKVLNCFKIKMEDFKYSFFIGDTLIGEGNINPCSWQEMRMYVTAGTDIMMHNFYILKN